MPNQNMDNHDYRETSRNSGRHTQRKLLLLQGLWSLMKLQYEHEGHIDEPVMDLFTVELFELEEHYSKYFDNLAPDKLPF